MSSPRHFLVVFQFVTVGEDKPIIKVLILIATLAKPESSGASWKGNEFINRTIQHSLLALNNQKALNTQIKYIIPSSLVRIILILLKNAKCKKQ